MKRKIISYILIVAVVVGVFYIFNTYIYEKKQGSEEMYEPYRATLEGEHVCLPHKNTAGQQTDECTPGIRTDTGEYYAIDLFLVSQEHVPLTVGDRIRANGLVTPIERLSTDHWQKYEVEGIFSITDTLQVLE